MPAAKNNQKKGDDDAKTGAIEEKPAEVPEEKAGTQEEKPSAAAVAVKELREEIQREATTALLDDEASSVFEVIHDLEGQLDSAFAVKEALEKDLEGEKEKTAALSLENAKLKERVTFLESCEKLVDEVQAELDFLNEDKSSSVIAIQQLESKLESLTEEKNGLAKELSATKIAFEGMKRKAVKLQSEVSRLEEKTATMEKLKKELDDNKLEICRANEQIQDIESQLFETSCTKDAFDVDLQSAQKVIEDLQEEIEELKSLRESLKMENLTLKSKLRIAENEKERLSQKNQESERKLSKALEEKDSLQNELSQSKQAFMNVHAALEETKQKAKKRYYFPESKKKKSPDKGKKKG